MTSKGLLLSPIVLAATAASAQLAPPSLTNVVTYSDWTSAPAICTVPSPPDNYVTTTQAAGNTDPVVLNGVSGSVSSTATYLGAAIQVVTTGCPNIQSGSVAGVTVQTNDIVTFAGGIGSGTGTVVLSYGNSRVTSSPTNYNFLSGGSYAMNVEMDAGPGSNVLFNAGYGVNVIEGSLSISEGCVFGRCSYNAATNQYLVPFTFPYGVPLHFGFNGPRAAAGNGYLVNFTGSLSFILPCGTTIAAESGTTYPVQYASSGTCSNSGDQVGDSADAPLPLWALGALGAVLFGVASRGLKRTPI